MGAPPVIRFRWPRDALLVSAWRRRMQCWAVAACEKLKNWDSSGLSKGIWCLMWLNIAQHGLVLLYKAVITVINWLWCASGSTCYPALDTAYNCPAWSHAKFGVPKFNWKMLDAPHFQRHLAVALYGHQSLVLPRVICWVYWIHMKDQRFRFESFMVALLVKVGIWSSLMFLF